MTTQEAMRSDSLDELLFADEEEPQPTHSGAPWKLLIVDDEREVHSITRMVLGDFRFDERPLQFFSAYSAQQAKSLLEQHPDMAIVLLDVVMETDHSGLDVARHIRAGLKNRFVRIILRTGQPGHAPESRVVLEYDINDYKEKTELTSQKLITTVISSLRAYRDLLTIERSRQGLEHILTSSRRLFERPGRKRFMGEVLNQFAELLCLSHDICPLGLSGFTVSSQGQEAIITSAIGVFSALVGESIDAIADPVCRNLCRQTLAQKESLLSSRAYTGYFRSNRQEENLIHLQTPRSLGELDAGLLRVFSSYISAAVENRFLNLELADTQKELIWTLGEVVENRSKETAHHVRRVAEYSTLLASRLGLGSEEIETLRLASPMHDVGKIGVPDAILNKPGPLTDEEFRVMTSHTGIGHDILKGSKRGVMQAASLIALQHHEFWNGKGYPQGLAGEQIHVFGRITALADVFDALGTRRVYRGPWELARILKLIGEERGRMFDPQMVDLFFGHLDEFLAIKNAYPDEP